MFAMPLLAQNLTVPAHSPHQASDPVCDKGSLFRVRLIPEDCLGGLGVLPSYSTVRTFHRDRQSPFDIRYQLPLEVQADTCRITVSLKDLVKQETSSWSDIRSVGYMLMTRCVTPRTRRKGYGGVVDVGETLGIELKIERIKTGGIDGGGGSATNITSGEAGVTVD